MVAGGCVVVVGGCVVVVAGGSVVGGAVVGGAVGGGAVVGGGVVVVRGRVVGVVLGDVAGGGTTVTVVVSVVGGRPSGPIRPGSVDVVVTDEVDVDVVGVVDVVVDRSTWSSSTSVRTRFSAESAKGPRPATLATTTSAEAATNHQNQRPSRNIATNLRLLPPNPSISTEPAAACARSRWGQNSSMSPRLKSMSVSAGIACSARGRQVTIGPCRGTGTKPCRTPSPMATA